MLARKDQIPARDAPAHRPAQDLRIMLNAAIALLAVPLAHAEVLPQGLSSTTFDNGLTLHVVPMSTPGVVSWQTWVEVGSKNELLPGTTGLAHLFEHLMFYGSAELPRAPREQELLTMGVTENAWTWLDDTVYTSVLPASSLERLVAIEADRFLNFQVSAEQLQREAGAVFGEYRMGLADPGSRLSEGLYAAAFGEHSYHHPTIGWLPDIQAMPQALDQATLFFNTWYRPERTRIIVSGDVDPEKVQAWVEREWSAWSVETLTLEQRVEPTQMERIRLDVPWEQGPVSPRLLMGFVVPGFDPLDPQSAAIELLGELLTSPTAPLYRSLVLEQQVILSLRGGSYQHQDPHLFLLSAELKSATDLDRVSGALLAELTRLAENPDPSQVTSARDHALRALQLRLDDPVAVSGLLGHFTRGGHSPADLETYYQSFAALTAQDIQRQAQHMLDPTQQSEARLATQLTSPPPSAEMQP